MQTAYKTIICSKSGKISAEAIKEGCEDVHDMKFLKNKTD